MAERMLRWVVTGPLGAGKSLLTGLLARQGAGVIDGDALGHDLLGQSDVRDELAAAYGQSVLRGGEINRAALGSLVFADPTELARLDSIMLPRLASRMRSAFRDLAAAGKTLAVLEAAIYYLLPRLGHIDLTITVTASEETRLRRLAARGRWPRAEAERRLAAQAHLREGWERSDVVVVNEGAPSELTAVASRLLAQHGPRGDGERMRRGG